MKKTVKLLCALLAIVMVVGLFAGCQKTPNTTTAPKGDGEKMKLTAVVQADSRFGLFNEITADKFPVYKAFQDLLDKYNLEIEWTVIQNDQWDTYISTAMANPDTLPDYLDANPIHRKHVPEQAKPGIVTGLAWTPVGGDILYIQSLLTQGSGPRTVTGQLGDVMKESAQIAVSLVKAMLPEQAQVLNENDRVGVADGHGRYNNRLTINAYRHIFVRNRSSHIDSHACDLPHVDVKLQGLNARKRLNGQACFIGISLVVNIFANAANPVSAHFSLTSVCVENAHFEIRDGRRRYVDHSVRACTEVSIGKLFR